MKFFRTEYDYDKGTGDKYNFVDENNVLVGFDAGES